MRRVAMGVAVVALGWLAGCGGGGRRLVNGGWDPVKGQAQAEVEAASGAVIVPVVEVLNEAMHLCWGLNPKGDPPILTTDTLAEQAKLWSNGDGGHAQPTVLLRVLHAGCVAYPQIDGAIAQLSR